MLYEGWISISLLIGSFVVWSRVDAAGAGARMTYGKFTVTGRSTLNSVPASQSMTSQGDDQPLNLADRLKSAPADPIETLHDFELHQARRPCQARCLIDHLHVFVVDRLVVKASCLPNTSIFEVQLTVVVHIGLPLPF